MSEVIMLLQVMVMVVITQCNLLTHQLLLKEMVAMPALGNGQ